MSPDDAVAVDQNDLDRPLGHLAARNGQHAERAVVDVKRVRRFGKNMPEDAFAVGKDKLPFLAHRRQRGGRGGGCLRPGVIAGRLRGRRNFGTRLGPGLRDVFFLFDLGLFRGGWGRGRVVRGISGSGISLPGSFFRGRNFQGRDLPYRELRFAAGCRSESAPETRPG